MDLPVTQYARAGDVHIAYQVFGDGPIDFVYIPGAFSHVEIMWENPVLAHAFERFARFARVVVFDKRGTGLSDRVGVGLTYENFVDDLLAVLDATGIERVAVYGQIDGAMIGTVFAATYPDRVRALVTYGMPAKPIRSDDWPWGLDREFWDPIRRDLDERGAVDLLLNISDPATVTNPELLAWSERWYRASIGPGGLLALIDAFMETDIRDVLPAVQAPTLVVHLDNDAFVPVENARYVAEHIAGAELLIVPGASTTRSLEDDVLDEVETFITGTRPAAVSDRVLATVLFADIVGSTKHAAELGDHRWKERLDRMDQVVNRELDRFRGAFVKNTGDGYLATFDGPARAIHCAQAIRDSLLALEIETRTGLHTGEIERRGEDVSGLGVHIASRVMDMADTGEILVSSTVKDLVVGSGIGFAERGEHELKGVPDRWRLFALAP